MAGIPSGGSHVDAGDMEKSQPSVSEVQPTSAVSSAQSAETDLASLRVELRSAFNSFAMAKDRGTSFFLAGDFSGASVCYLHALGCADATQADRIVALGNLAQCDLRSGRPREALEWCNRALADDPGHVRNLYRKSTALELLGELELARKTLARAQSLIAAAPVEAVPQSLSVDVDQKLQGVVARLEQQHLRERQEKEKQQRVREAAVARSRPSIGSLDGAGCTTAASSTATLGATLGYHERDWIPRFRQQLLECSGGDPNATSRLRIDTLRGICMTYLPDRLPSKDMKALEAAQSLQWLQAINGGAKSSPENAPPPLPSSRELANRLQEHVVTGDVTEWRNGSRSGLRYDLQVLLWWRIVEKFPDDETERLEGTIRLHATDREEASKWSVIVQEDDEQRSRPDDARVTPMLEGAHLLGERARALVKEILTGLERKAHE